jgi:hypothetical protein
MRLLLKIGPSDVNGTRRGGAWGGPGGCVKIVEKTIALAGAFRNFFRLIFGTTLTSTYGRRRK